MVAGYRASLKRCGGREQAVFAPPAGDELHANGQAVDPAARDGKRRQPRE